MTWIASLTPGSIAEAGAGGRSRGGGLLFDSAAMATCRIGGAERPGAAAPLRERGLRRHPGAAGASRMSPGRHPAVRATADVRSMAPPPRPLGARAPPCSGSRDGAPAAHFGSVRSVLVAEGRFERLLLARHAGPGRERHHGHQGERGGAAEGEGRPPGSRGRRRRSRGGASRRRPRPARGGARAAPRWRARSAAPSRWMASTRRSSPAPARATPAQRRAWPPGSGQTPARSLQAESIGVRSGTRTSVASTSLWSEALRGSRGRRGSPASAPYPRPTRRAARRRAGGAAGRGAPHAPRQERGVEGQREGAAQDESAGLFAAGAAGSVTAAI